MIWLFLDDERTPPAVVTGANKLVEWVVVRTFDEFTKYLLDNGCPEYISFDHDLGHEILTGMSCARALVEFDLNGMINIPEDFVWYVHSQNPVGKENIDKYLKSYLNFRELYKEK